MSVLPVRIHVISGVNRNPIPREIEPFLISLEGSSYRESTVLIIVVFLLIPRLVKVSQCRLVEI